MFEGDLNAQAADTLFEPLKSAENTWDLDKTKAFMAHLRSSKPQKPLIKATDSLFADLALKKLSSMDADIAKRRQNMARFAVSSVSDAVTYALAIPSCSQLAWDKFSFLCAVRDTFLMDMPVCTHGRDT